MTLAGLAKRALDLSLVPNRRLGRFLALPTASCRAHCSAAALADQLVGVLSGLPVVPAKHTSQAYHRDLPVECPPYTTGLSTVQRAPGQAPISVVESQATWLRSCAVTSDCTAGRENGRAENLGGSDSRRHWVSESPGAAGAPF